MIVSSNTIVDKIYDGNITIQANAVLKMTGIVNGNISVENGALLNLTGILNGEILIKNEAHAEIRGIVNDTITNYGNLVVYGIVKKVNNITGYLDIKPNAIIDGKQY